MKKALSIIALILLAGCSSSTTFDAKKADIELEIQRDKDCQSYQEVLEKKLDQEVAEGIIEIFYSPKQESCLAIYRLGISNWATKEMRDVLSGEVLASIQYVVDLAGFDPEFKSEQQTNFFAFDQKVTSYK